MTVDRLTLGTATTATPPWFVVDDLQLGSRRREVDGTRRSRRHATSEQDKRRPVNGHDARPEGRRAFLSFLRMEQFLHWACFRTIYNTVNHFFLINSSTTSLLAILPILPKMECTILGLFRVPNQV